MSDISKATPRPWRVVGLYNDRIMGADGTISFSLPYRDVDALLMVEAVNAYDTLRAENARLREALHRISLGSQNSGTTKEYLGREARAALVDK